MTFLRKMNLAWLVAAFGAAVVCVLWYWYWNNSLGMTRTEAGQFGDKFGALNTLFTGLALVGLVATLVHQHQQVEGLKSDYQRVLGALSDVSGAVSKQNLSLDRSNYLNALVARIEGYNHQQTHHRQIYGQGKMQLIQEQESLLWELKHALDDARAKAGAEGNQKRGE